MHTSKALTKSLITIQADNRADASLIVAKIVGHALKVDQVVYNSTPQGVVAVVAATRRPCWGNWKSDVVRDLKTAQERAGVKATVTITKFERVIVEQRENAVELIKSQVKAHANSLFAAANLPQVKDLLLVF